MGHTRGGRKKPMAQPKKPVHDVHVEGGVRLQKVLADAGIGSRRECENLIADGRVEVDGQLVYELGVRVDPATASIAVDGLSIQTDTSKVTLVVNKPRKMVSTMSDPQGRPTIAELVAGRSERLFHVGRLDYESEGIIILTNDGELANRLAHPRFEIEKTYMVTVRGKVANGVGSQLLKGIELEDGHAELDRFRIIDHTAAETLIEVSLHSGRNRIVRRMFDEVGYPVERLVRTQIGPIKIGDLKQGKYRILGKVELGTLMKAVDL
ncbi:pseudouridine synthase [Timonella senegalensis]|uniref:pseudouridine synthase n=1 Tax=Timonella senegalensis TaxID=1465825 RepID=UPI0028B03C09|nr:pseudouridine synthase [Timonella senegalensis]